MQGKRKGNEGKPTSGRAGEALGKRRARVGERGGSIGEHREA